jgi:hypothetical protein
VGHVRTKDHLHLEGLIHIHPVHAHHYESSMTDVHESKTHESKTSHPSDRRSSVSKPASVASVVDSVYMGHSGEPSKYYVHYFQTMMALLYHAFKWAQSETYRRRLMEFLIDPSERHLFVCHSCPVAHTHTDQTLVSSSSSFFGSFQNTPKKMDTFSRFAGFFFCCRFYFVLHVNPYMPVVHRRMTLSTKKSSR